MCFNQTTKDFSMAKPQMPNGISTHNIKLWPLSLGTYFCSLQMQIKLTGLNPFLLLAKLH